MSGDVADAGDLADDGMQEMQTGTLIAGSTGSNTLAMIFVGGTMPSFLDEIERRVLEVETDVTTPKGRAGIKSLAHRVSRTKIALDDAGKDLTEQQRRTIDAVNADRRVCRDRLDALRDRVRKPLVEFEEQEMRRVEAHQRAIAALESLVLIDTTAESALDVISERLELLASPTQHEWQEFAQRAAQTREYVHTRLLQLKRQAERNAEARAQAAREAEEAAHAERERVAQLQAERELRIAEEAAAAAQEKAAREHQAEQQRLQRDAEARQAESDRRIEAANYAQQQAERRAAEAENARAESERRVEAERVAREERARAAAEHEAQRKREAQAQYETHVNEAIGGLELLGLSRPDAELVVGCIIGCQVPHINFDHG